MNFKSLLKTLLLVAILAATTPFTASAETMEAEMELVYGGKGKKKKKGCRIISKRNKKAKKSKEKSARRKSKKRSIGTYL